MVEQQTKPFIPLFLKVFHHQCKKTNPGMTSKLFIRYGIYSGVLPASLSAHITFDLKSSETETIASLCFNNNQCIVPSSVYQSKYEIANGLHRVCHNCAIFAMRYTNYFKDVWHITRSPKQQLKWMQQVENRTHTDWIIPLLKMNVINRILSGMIAIVMQPHVQAFLMHNKCVLKTVLKIFFANGSCLSDPLLCAHRKFNRLKDTVKHDPENHFLAECNIYICLEYLLKYGFNRKYLKWFMKLYNGKYYKIFVLDKYAWTETKWDLKTKMLMCSRQDCGLRIIVNVVRHNKYLYNALHRTSKPLQYLNETIKVFEILRLWVADMRENILVQYYQIIHCNNPKCKVGYFEHVYGLTVDVNKTSYEEVYKQNRKNKWYKCKRCKLVYYCSRKCQKYDWNICNHQIICCLHQ